MFIRLASWLRWRLDREWRAKLIEQQEQVVATELAVRRFEASLPGRRFTRGERRQVAEMIEWGQQLVDPRYAVRFEKGEMKGSQAARDVLTTSVLSEEQHRALSDQWNLPEPGWTMLSDDEEARADFDGNVWHRVATWERWPGDSGGESPVLRLGGWFGDGEPYAKHFYGDKAGLMDGSDAMPEPLPNDINAIKTRRQTQEEIDERLKPVLAQQAERKAAYQADRSRVQEQRKSRAKQREEQQLIAAQYQQEADRIREEREEKKRASGCAKLAPGQRVEKADGTWEGQIVGNG